MGNNPGKKGKPAPWVKKENEHREREWDQYRRSHHPAYDEWLTRRTEAARTFRKEADAKYPGDAEIGNSIKEAGKKLRKWDKQNQSPMTWEESQRLEAAFDAEYVRPDFS